MLVYISLKSSKFLALKIVIANLHEFKPYCSMRVKTKNMKIASSYKFSNTYFIIQLIKFIHFLFFIYYLFM